MTELTILDIGSFRSDPSTAAGRRFAEALCDALRDIGFAHIVGHGVDADLAAVVQLHSRAFFALDEEHRRAIRNTNSPHFRGYTVLGHERTGGSPDWRDQIDVGPEGVGVEIGQGDPAWLRLRGPNQWPAEIPELRVVVLEWMRQMQALADDTLRAIAVGLGQRIDFFDAAVQQPHSVTKIIRYPPSPSTSPSAEGDAAGQGVGWHQDGGLLTFIHQDDVGGLQVALPARAGGEVIDATPVPGAYLLNLGEMLQLATAGYLKATRHRVVSPPAGRQRLSIAFFANPNLEATLPSVELPAELAAQTDGGQNDDAGDAVHAVFGDNFMKFRMRSHPDVAAIHHADLLSQVTP